MNIQSGFSRKLVLAFAAICTLAAAANAQTTLYLYSARATLIGYLKTQTTAGETLTPFSLDNRQLINLAMGNPIRNTPPPGYELAVAADYNASVAGDPNANKEIVIVNTNQTPHVVAATLVVSDNTTVYNAQDTVHTFRRFGFGAGNVQTLGNAQFGTTGGRVQLLGVLHKHLVKQGTETVPTPILNLSMVGNLDMTLVGEARNFYIVSGVITASGSPIGQTTLP